MKFQEIGRNQLTVHGVDGVEPCLLALILVTKIGKKCISINLMNDMQINLQQLQKHRCSFFIAITVTSGFIYR